jgi:hypothetical protein
MRLILLQIVQRVEALEQGHIVGALGRHDVDTYFHVLDLRNMACHAEQDFAQFVDVFRGAIGEFEENDVREHDYPFVSIDLAGFLLIARAFSV